MMTKEDFYDYLRAFEIYEGDIVLTVEYNKMVSAILVYFRKIMLWGLNTIYMKSAKMGTAWFVVMVHTRNGKHPIGLTQVTKNTVTMQINIEREKKNENKN